MCPIAWDDGPRMGSPPPAHPIHNVKQRSFLLLLGPAFGVFVHWNHARTLPCLG
jgi:hypothetical protein